MRPIDAHHNGVRWEGELPGRDPGLVGVLDRGLDRPVRHLARRDPAQGRRRPGGPLGRAVRGRRAARAGQAQGRRRQARDRPRAERAAATATRPQQTRWEAALSPELADAMERSQGRHGVHAAREGAAAGGRPRARALRLLVRGLPALLGRDQGRRGARARPRRDGLRRGLHDPDPPDRRHQPQGPQQHARRRPRRPRLAVRGRRQGGRPRRRPPRPRHRRRRARPVRDGARARHGRLHGLRDQRVRRPPVADRAPRVVPPPPGRDAQVRREPAQEVPGHLQRQLGVRGLARPVGRVAADLPVLGRRRREGLPRRQPAHEAVPVLGVADQGGPQGRPRRGLPRRGVHAPRRDARAGQARLHAVLHVLHLEDLALGADGVRQRARPHRGAGVLPAQLLPRHAGHPRVLPRARRPGRVPRAADPGRHAVAQLRHLLGLRALRERAGPRGLGGVPQLGEVRDVGAQRSTGRCCR